MRFCLTFILLVLVLGFAGITIAFNVCVSQSLSFEKKDNIDVFINTRRSYRPMSSDVKGGIAE